MAEFQEVIKQFKRMCWYYQRNSDCPMGCPMNGVNISQCRKVAFDEPEVTEKTVMAWAAEHPEPVYPTYWTWLINSGVINGCTNKGAIERLQMTPIPADMAQKLGIEPKEGVC